MKRARSHATIQGKTNARRGAAEVGDVPTLKLLTIAIPSYNSQDYLSHAVESLLPGGDDVEILIVDDGSSDRTAEIADDYERRYPGIVRAIHKPNGGHGDAVMAGLAGASGRYFKVVDSDDWVDADAYPRVLDTLRAYEDAPIDMLICNYIYDKAGASRPYVMHYRRTLPQDRVFSWEETHRFHKGHYILMHSVIYRTQLLKDCRMTLPKHTFYVDDLYVYVPLKDVRRMVYLDADFYHYCIGREDQSVQEQMMIRRIDQFIKVNRLLFTEVDLNAIADPHLYRYMLNFLEIITTISSVLCIKAGTPEHLRKKEALWAYLRSADPETYRRLRRRILGRAVHLKTRTGHAALRIAYRVANKIYGFN